MEIVIPEGYRPVRDSDIAVGLAVVYVRRAGGQELHTKVEDATIIKDDELGPSIRLEAKHVAAMSRIFVPTTAVVDKELSDADIKDANMFLKTAVAPWRVYGEERPGERSHFTRGS